MKVVILCGGKGTRLREETEFRPKPMVPIGNRPVVWHIMKTYAHYGYNDFILCIGYKGDIIKEYFRNYLWNTCDTTLSLGRNPSVEFHTSHEEEDWTVTLADTGEESMTAYRVKQIQKYIPQGESFLMTYGDGLATIDINASIAEHRIAKKTCTISAVHPAGRFGSLRIEDNGKIHAFSEKPQFEDAFVNGGYMVCDYGLFDYLPNDPNMMLERQPMDNLVRDSQLHAFKHEGFWQPMDTLREKHDLEKLALLNPPSWLAI